MKRYDTVIIGGGAAGLCAAVRLKQKSPELSVVILEQLQRVGKKLITTGNGRCNITNAAVSFDRFHSDNPSFFEYAVSVYDNAVIEDFFESVGVVFTYDESGRAYPYSLQASSVVDALRFSADSAGVEILTETAVTDIKKENGCYKIICADKTIFGKSVLAAAGLLSGGNKLGSNGSILNILKNKGYKTVRTTPAIVQLKTEPQIVRQLKGIKVNAFVSLLHDGKEISREYGEVLFCDYGLSGPPIMHLSRSVERLSGAFTVSLDLMPEYNFNSLYQMLSFRVKALSGRNLDEFLTGLLNKRVGQTLLKCCGFNLGDGVAVLDNNSIKRLASKIKGFVFNVTGTTGFDNSQVTAGGLDTTGFCPENMMSFLDSGLFAAGEILDVDGDCGGFNLRWAWSSAMCAADGIINYLGGAK